MHKKVHPLKRTRRNRVIYELFIKRDDKGERVHPVVQLAKEFGVTRTRIYQIADQFRELGKVRSPYRDLAEYLALENERLLKLLEENGISSDPTS